MASSTGSLQNLPFGPKAPFKAPSWVPKSVTAPQSRIPLTQPVPTPLHRWSLPESLLPKGVELYVKRDDLTGMQLSGNKVRKLEFLLADAIERGADCVVTLGGQQSNHCRATAVAARYLGLDSVLVLRCSREQCDKGDVGLEGNLMVERMAGAQIQVVTRGEYEKHGSPALGRACVQRLIEEGKYENPYLVPVGGSNALGTWGYVVASGEIADQAKAMGVAVTDVVVACGSGGTTAGLALGNKWSGLGAKLTAYTVCDDPAFFYAECQSLIDGLTATQGQDDIREMLSLKQAMGRGYAQSTQEELETCRAVAAASGIILDPVYSGKALHGLLTDIRADPDAWKGRKVVFVHTGGLLGMFDKQDQLQSLVEAPNGAPSQTRFQFPPEMGGEQPITDDES